MLNHRFTFVDPKPTYMYCKTIPLLIGIFMLTACGSKEPGQNVTIDNGIITIDILETVKDVREFNLSELAKGVEFVILESTVESYFKQARSLKVTKNYILIACDLTDKVLLFDRSGKFLRQIGRTGQGPGEYTDPWFASIDPKEKYVLICNSGYRKILKYTIKGDFVMEKNLSDKEYSFINGAPFFFNKDYFGIPIRRPLEPMDNFASILVFDQNLDIYKSILNQPNDDDLCIWMPYQKLYQGSDKIIYWEGYTNIAYSISLNNEPKPLYYFKIKKGGYSMDYLKRKDRNISQLEFYFLTNMIDLPNHLLLKGFTGEAVDIVYDKKEKEAYSATTPFNCSNLQSSTLKGSWNNDLFGFEPFSIRTVNYEENLLVSYIKLSRAETTTDIECLRKLDVKFPKMRDRMADMIQNYSGEELPVVVLLEMK